MVTAGKNFNDGNRERLFGSGAALGLALLVATIAGVSSGPSAQVYETKLGREIRTYHPLWGSNRGVDERDGKLDYEFNKVGRKTFRVNPELQTKYESLI